MGTDAAPDRLPDDVEFLVVGGPTHAFAMATPATRPGFGLVAGRFLRRNASYVAGLAAAVLIAFGAYWMWPRSAT